MKNKYQIILTTLLLCILLYQSEFVFAQCCNNRPYYLCGINENSIYWTNRWTWDPPDYSGEIIFEGTDCYKLFTCESMNELDLSVESPEPLKLTIMFRAYNNYVKSGEWYIDHGVEVFFENDRNMKKYTIIWNWNDRHEGTEARKLIFYPEDLSVDFECTATNSELEWRGRYVHLLDVDIISYEGKPFYVLSLEIPTFMDESTDFYFSIQPENNNDIEGKFSEEEVSCKVYDKNHVPKINYAYSDPDADPFNLDEVCRADLNFTPVQGADGYTLHWEWTDKGGPHTKEIFIPNHIPDLNVGSWLLCDLWLPTTDRSHRVAFEGYHQEADGSYTLNIWFYRFWADGADFFFKMKSVYHGDAGSFESDWSNIESCYVVDAPNMVISPNGNDLISFGGAMDIYWAQGWMGDYANIAFSGDGGDNWVPVASNVSNLRPDMDIAYYNWNLTAETLPSNTCLIRVYDTEEGLPCDDSDSYFKIAHPAQNITLSSMNDGGSFNPDTTVSIEWSASDFSGDVKMRYSNDDGQTWQTMVQGSPIPHDDGTFAWTIPEEATHQCRVQVKDAYWSEPNDASDMCFSIVNPEAAITLNEPNGTKLYQSGTELDILWTNHKFAGVVKLECSKDNGLTWDTFADSLSNTGCYTWTVDTVESHEYLIRVSDTFDASLNDVSDSPFSVTNTEPVTIVLQPDAIAGIDNSLEYHSDPDLQVNLDSKNGGIFHMGCGAIKDDPEDIHSRTHRPLLKFDLSSIGFAYVQSATLSLYCYKDTLRDGSEFVNLHKVNQPWDEMNSCWNRPGTGGPNWNGCEPDNFWSESNPCAVINGPMQGEWSSCDIGEQVNAWALNPAHNHGVMMKLPDDDGSEQFKVRFLSSDNVEATYHPKLEITYFPQSVMPNQPPSVSAGHYCVAGIDEPFMLPGQVIDDATPACSVEWTYDENGPGSVVFADAHAVNTTATFSIAGDYNLFLSASDGQLGSSDTLLVTVIDPEQHITLNPIADNFVVAEQGQAWSFDQNYGGLYKMNIGNRLDGVAKIYRPLLKFDLSSIPQNAVIESADLKLYSYYGARNDIANLHKVLVDWNEFESCWNRPVAGAGPWWGCAPNDVFASSAVSASTTLLTSSGWYTWAVTDLIQEFVTDPELNHGMMIKLTNDGFTSTQRYFYIFSTNSSDSTLYPVLDITYSVPIGKEIGDNKGEIAGVPKTFAMSQNYPNPFNPTTTIDYQLPENAEVKIKVYDMLGRQIATLVNEEKQAGYHQVVWKGRNDQGVQVASGIYIIQMLAAEHRFVKKVLMVK